MKGDPGRSHRGNERTRGQNFVGANLAFPFVRLGGSHVKVINHVTAVKAQVQTQCAVQLFLNSDSGCLQVRGRFQR